MKTLAGIVNLPVPTVEAVFGLKPGDMVTPYAFPLLEAMGTPLTALPDFTAQGPVVIRTATLNQIRVDVIAYNIVIATEAVLHHATLVDIYSGQQSRLHCETSRLRFASPALAAKFRQRPTRAELPRT